MAYAVAKRPPGLGTLTPKQAECTRYQVAGNFTHFMTYGGGRSTKTFRAVRLVIARALAAPASRHAIIRQAANHVKASVFLDTFPKVLRLCFPGLKVELNKKDLYAVLPNGSEIWFMGLDDGERTEKILGMEFATLFFNECSQLSWRSVSMIWTRLAQACPLPQAANDNTPPKLLRLMALYDCNPPKTKKHWTYQLFIEKKDPATQKPLPNPDDFGVFQMNPADNPHLPAETLAIYMSMSGADRKRFFDGLFGDDTGGLWKWADFKPTPTDRSLWPDFVRIVVAVDPPAGKTNATEDEAAKLAEAGIVVIGLGTNGIAYVLADRSMQGTPEQWGAAAVRAYVNFGADAIVGEVNQGGDMVRAVVHAVNSSVNFRPVRATRGKVKRAEPVAALYGRGKVLHYTGLDTLENQMCEFTVDFDVAKAGYSPDRVDALVWGVTDLMLTKTAGSGTMAVTGT